MAEMKSVHILTEKGEINSPVCKSRCRRRL